MYIYINYTLIATEWQEKKLNVVLQQSMQCVLKYNLLRTFGPKLPVRDVQSQATWEAHIDTNNYKQQAPTKGSPGLRGVGVQM